MLNDGRFYTRSADVKEKQNAPLPDARQGAQAARRGRAFDGVTKKTVKAQCVTTKQSGKVQPRDGSAAKHVAD